MKICQIFHPDYPWDVRVEKICKTLLKYKHEVHLICNNSRQEPKEEVIDGIYIHRLPVSKNIRINKLLSFPVFFNPYWIFYIYRVTKNYRFDAILVRDLPLVLTAWFSCLWFKIPIIFDMAENYPAMWQNFTSFFKLPFLARILETVSLRIVDHVFVVVDESKDRIVEKGITDNKVSIVSNTPELDLFEKNIDNHKLPIFSDEDLNLLYVGYIVKLRGLDTVIKALPTLNKKIFNLKLTIIGTGKTLSDLKLLATEIDVNDYINFSGWIDFKYIPYIISKCDIGVIPHYSNEHTCSTIPNKLFDFMACAKPIIVSDAKPLKRIIENLNCGVIFESGNSNDFTKKTLLLTEESQRKKMGGKGHQAVRNYYNWDKDFERLNNAVIKTIKTHHSNEIFS